MVNKPPPYAVRPFESVNITWIPSVSGLVGIPDMTPSELRVIPCGSKNGVGLDQVYGGFPFTPAKLNEYVTPARPSGKNPQNPPSGGGSTLGRGTSESLDLLP